MAKNPAQSRGGRRAGSGDGSAKWERTYFGNEVNLIDFREAGIGHQFADTLRALTVLWIIFQLGE
jgi:hypothetical protein